MSEGMSEGNVRRRTPEGSVQRECPIRMSKGMLPRRKSFGGMSEGEYPKGNVQGNIREQLRGKCPERMSQGNVQRKCLRGMSDKNVHGNVQGGMCDRKCPGECARGKGCGNV